MASVNLRVNGRAHTVDVDPTDPIDPSPVFSLVVVSATDGSRKPGLHVTFHGWKGPARYGLGTAGAVGEAVAYDEALLSDCGRASDTSCYEATTDCSVEIETWDLGPVGVPGVANGTATGTVTCDRLENAITEEGKVMV